MTTFSNESIGDVYNKNNVITHISFVENEMICVHMIDGRIIQMPMSWFPWLQNATAEQRADFEVFGTSVDWEQLGEGFSIEPATLGRSKTA